MDVLTWVIVEQHQADVSVPNSSGLSVWNYGIYWRPIRSRTWAFQRNHYLTPKIQDGWDPPSWKSIRHHFFLPTVVRFGAEWHVDSGDMVEIETRCRIPIWRTFGWIQCHVIPEPPATFQGAATWWIHCHDSGATCHIAGCSHLAKSMSWSCHIATSAILKIVFRHIFLKMQFGLWRAEAFILYPMQLFFKNCI